MSSTPVADKFNQLASKMLAADTDESNREACQFMFFSGVAAMEFMTFHDASKLPAKEANALIRQIRAEVGEWMDEYFARRAQAIGTLQ